MVARRCGEDRTPWAIFLHNRPVLYVTDANMVLHNWTPVMEARPVTLDDLADAWATAEQANECRDGDILIIRDDEDNYLVRRMDDYSDLDSTARILSRAPKREPWEDLADVLKDFEAGEGAAVALARELYERGVRVS